MPATAVSMLWRATIALDAGCRKAVDGVRRPAALEGGSRRTRYRPRPPAHRATIRPLSQPEARPIPPQRVIRAAIVGKGGAGKSVIAGTLARVLARRGHRVLALDSDTLPGLELSLGAQPPADPPLLDAAERGEDRRWRYKRGIGPVRAVQRYATPAPDGVRLLQAGKLTEAGRGPLMPALQAYYRTIQGLAEARALREWTLLGDLPAGPRQVVFEWAPYADTFVLVVEPTWQSMMTARRIGRLASMRDGVTVNAVVNKVRREADVRRVEDFLGGRSAARLPAEAAVRDAEREGAALIDAAPDSDAVAAVEALADGLEDGSLPSVSAR